MFPCLTALIAIQEYLPRIKDNDVLRAVEKNTSGSRPKELFEEVLEEVDKQWEADRSVLSALLALLLCCNLQVILVPADPCRKRSSGELT